MRPVQFEIQTILDWDDWKQTCIPRLRHARGLDIPHLPQFHPHLGKCAIVGAGPSVKHYVEQIKAIGAGDLNLVLTVNGAHDWLIQQDVPPDIHVVSEMDLEDARVALGGHPHPDVAYYICSYCAPSIFLQLASYRRVLWHAFCAPQGYQQAIAKYFPGDFMVAGGFCTFFRTLTIATILGYRDIELFGIDSSFEDSSHVDGYVLADKEPRIKLWGADPNHVDLRQFTTQGGLAFQVREFLDYCKHNQAGLSLRVHGDGLLRYVHESRYPEQYLP